MMLGRNLGKARRTSRLRGGVVALALALGLALGLAHLRAQAPLHALVFVPFFIASWHIVQGLGGTDPLLAARGLRDMGDGPEPIAGAEELARVRAAGRLVNRIALAAATLLTALIVITASFTGGGAHTP
jgi:hypothetical protein